MSNNSPQPRSEADAEWEREIRAERKFSLTEAIGRMAGPGMMKGESPITRKRQAEAQLQECLARHIVDVGGVLPGVLLRRVSESELLLKHMEQPLVALVEYIRGILQSDYRLKELVRETDVEWGRVSGERPHFEREGQPPDPNDPYTFESVRTTLSRLVEALSEAKS